MELDIEDIIRRYYEKRQYNDTTELCHLMKKHDCDKGLGFHNYSTFYHALFKGIREEPIKFLEIGHKKKGVSLPVWREYFSKATILGADVEPIEDMPGVTPAIPFDQRSSDEIHTLFKKIGDVDVILDDGIHEFGANWELFTHAFSYLKEGGVYIVEDLKSETRELFAQKRDEILSRFHLEVFHILDIPYSRNQFDNRILVLKKYRRPSLTVVTAASQNHSKSLIQFLCSMIVNKVPFEEVFVYDLGLDPTTLRIIKDMFPAHHIRLRSFHYDKYPDYFDIHTNAGQYAWKPVIIEEVAKEVKKGLLFWCDAGNKIMDNMQSLFEFMRTTYIYTPASSGTIRQWTHPRMLEYFFIQPNDIMNEKIMRNAAQVCFHLCEDTMEFIEEWSYCAQVRDCIAPKGSDRTNHRQDQSILSILYYRYLRQYPHRIHEVRDEYFVQIHQDID